jgi:hypothetical protein
MTLGVSFTRIEGKGPLFMPDLHSLLRPPDIYLIIAVIQLSWGVFFTWTGKAKAPYAPSVYRAQQPIMFWWTVGLCYLVGVIFIGYFLYKVYVPSN